ncbi:radical SAM protein [Candidatus Woesearchaeota archaeon]|nr:radical SAM protein [Candidatus Woesearchaeota archaeon]
MEDYGSKKSRSILISFVGIPHLISSFQPDNGLASLAASLISQGHETLILDYAVPKTVKRLFPEDLNEKITSLLEGIELKRMQGKEPDKEEISRLKALEKKIDEHIGKQALKVAEEISLKIQEMQPDFIAFKLFMGQPFHCSLLIAEAIKKENPGLLIFGGGPQVDGFMEDLFSETSAFDALAYGEGEKTILMLADYSLGKRKLKDIPNLIFRDDGKVTKTRLERIESLDELPSPEYSPSIYPAMEGDQKIKAFLIEDNRGCPYCCNFCLHPLKSGKRWRIRAAKAVVDEIESSVKRNRMNLFRLIASSPSQKLRIEIADELIRRKLDIRWTGFERASSQPKEYYQKLKDSGCVSLFFGIESGSSFILDEVMNKQITKEQARNSIRLCKEAGIYAIVGIIFPAPLETRETEKETVEFLLEARPDSVVPTAPLLQTGTEWEKNKEKYGFKLKDPKSFSKTMMSYKIKFSAPSYLWLPLPWSMGGKTSEEINDKSGELANILIKEGINVGVLDYSVLLASHLGIKIGDFGDVSRKMLETGDYAGLARMIEKINCKIKDL